MQLRLDCLIFNTPTKSQQKAPLNYINSLAVEFVLGFRKKRGKLLCLFHRPPLKTHLTKLFTLQGKQYWYKLMHVSICTYWTIETHIDTSTNIFSGVDGVCMWAFIIQIQHNGHALVDRAIRSYTVLRLKIPWLRKGGVSCRKHLKQLNEHPSNIFESLI